VVCERCTVADNALSRFIGLMGRSSLASDEGLLLRPCGSVHTFFMRFPIDVVYCDPDLRVLSVTPSLGRRRTRRQRGARVTIELAAGEAARRGVAAGAQLRLVEQ
jgi:uncharacterized membrane protein (UPF0127 family)